MRVLVTGSSGFFGSFLVPALTNAGHEVVGYDAKEGQDLFDVNGLNEAARGCDAVVHLVAIPHYHAGTPPQYYTRLNVIGTARVVKAMKAAKVRRLVYISSGALYGFGPGRPVEGWVKPPIQEGGEANHADWGKLDIYGAGKIAVEEWLSLVQGVSITVLRVNCIEPFHGGAKDVGDHWGWWCSQGLVAKGVLAALERTAKVLEIVNLTENGEHMDTSNMVALLEGKL